MFLLEEKMLCSVDTGFDRPRCIIYKFNQRVAGGNFSFGNRESDSFRRAAVFLYGSTLSFHDYGSQLCSRLRRMSPWFWNVESFLQTHSFRIMGRIRKTPRWEFLLRRYRFISLDSGRSIELQATLHRYDAAALFVAVCEQTQKCCEKLVLLTADQFLPQTSPHLFTMPSPTLELSLCG